MKLGWADPIGQWKARGCGNLMVTCFYIPTSLKGAQTTTKEKIVYQRNMVIVTSGMMMTVIVIGRTFAKNQREFQKTS